MNKLATWLKDKKITQRAFAAEIGMSEPYVSQICADPPAFWPSREVFVRIGEATEGAISPNDFLPEAAE